MNGAARGALQRAPRRARGCRQLAQCLGPGGAGEWYGPCSSRSILLGGERPRR